MDPSEIYTAVMMQHQMNMLIGRDVYEEMIVEFQNFEVSCCGSRLNDHRYAVQISNFVSFQLSTESARYHENWKPVS